MRRRSLACLLSLLGSIAVALPAARSDGGESEASRLGGAELTPLGAERAGNAAGTIPAWTGGITRWPDGYQPGARHPDPFAGDPVLFTIDAGNAEEHAEHLSEGQLALLRAYPETWRMRVRASRRSASYPSWVYEAIAENARTAKLVVEGKGGVIDSRVSSPFPLPKQGVEVVWNHTLRFRGVRVSRSDGIAAVTRSGRFRLVLTEQEFAFPYGGRTASAFTRQYPNLLLAYKSKTVQPALLTGDGQLVLEPIDQTRAPRKSWTYLRDLGRVVRDPTITYHFPAPNSEGLRTVDDFELFVGPPDRFEWRLLGKRELYVPYNAYQLHSDAHSPGDLVRRGHIAPDLARYELHRVWVVEGILREGMEHIYSRRVFYVDEDSWQIAVADSWSRDGKLWRVGEAHALNYYEVPVHWSTLVVHHDLHARRVLVSGLDNDRNVHRFSEGGDPREFTPNALLYFVR